MADLHYLKKRRQTWYSRVPVVSGSAACLSMDRMIRVISPRRGVLAVALHEAGGGAV